MDAAANEASHDLAAVHFDGAPGAMPAVTEQVLPATSDEPAPYSGDDLDEALRSAQAGVDAGFVQVYRALQPGLLRYLSTFVGDQADDVASDTWAQVCRDMIQFTGDFSQFRGWVTRIGRNRAIDHLRAQGRRPVLFFPQEDFHQVSGPADTATEAVDAVSTAAAIRLICSLPPDQAEAVLVRIVMGVDAKTTGLVLGKRAGAVRTLTHRGLRTLAARLEETP